MTKYNKRTTQTNYKIITVVIKMQIQIVNIGQYVINDNI
jgi:hypothetical protein